MFFLIVLLAIIAGINGQTTLNTQNCTTNEGFDQPINLYLDGCQAAPCELPQLQDAVINIVFKAPRTMRSMSTRALAFVLIGPVITPGISYDLGEQSITCNFINNTYCPLLEKEVVQYTLKMYIERFMVVRTNAIVEFFVVDQDELPVFCSRLQIEIIDGNSTNTYR